MEGLVQAIASDDFTFLGLTTPEIESKHPKNEIERQAFITALDSVLWSTTSEDVSSYSTLKAIKFPKVFQLSEKALQLTNKFNGL